MTVVAAPQVLETPEMVGSDVAYQTGANATDNVCGHQQESVGHPNW
jgi:hypothetical protein